MISPCIYRKQLKRQARLEHGEDNKVHMKKHYPCDIIWRGCWTQDSCSQLPSKSSLIYIDSPMGELWLTLHIDKARLCDPGNAIYRITGWAWTRQPWITEGKQEGDGRMKCLCYGVSTELCANQSAVYMCVYGVWNHSVFTHLYLLYNLLYLPLSPHSHLWWASGRFAGFFFLRVFTGIFACVWDLRVFFLLFLVNGNLVTV